MARFSRISPVMLIIGSLAACSSDPATVLCPEGTVATEDGCLEGCDSDDDCLFAEVCDVSARTCVPGTGRRPVITFFDSDPDRVTSGRPVRLEFEVQNAETLELNGAPITGWNDMGQGETWTSALTAPTSFVLVARGPGGRDESEIVVDVTNDISVPTIIDFEVRPNPTTPLVPVTAYWRVAGAETIDILVDGLPKHQTRDGIGEVQLDPIRQTAEITLLATNIAGQKSQALTLVVSEDAFTITGLSANPERTSPGGNVRLSWSAPGAVSVEVERTIGGEALFESTVAAVAARGGIIVPTPWPADLSRTETSGFAVTARNDQGAEASETVQVTTVPRPQIVDFTVSPAVFVLGGGGPVQEVTVSWQVERAQGVGLSLGDESMGGLPASGSRSFTFDATTVVELGAIGPLGQVVRRRVAHRADTVADTSEGDPWRLEHGAAVRTCVGQITGLSDWYEVEVPTRGSHLGVSLRHGEQAPCWPDLTLALLDSSGTVLGTAQTSNDGTCPRIDPRVHPFARDLDNDRYVLRLETSTLCFPYAISAVEILPGCGNGIVEGSESCDEADTVVGDGCRPDCGFDPGFGYTVVETPSASAPPQGTALVFENPNGSSGGRQPWDEGIATEALPFPFTFFGRTYGFVSVSTNGYLTFADAAAPTAPAAIPSPELPNALIAALAADLVVDPNVGRVTRGISGTSPRRRFVISYEDVALAQDPDTRLNAAISLEEGTNIVHIDYGPHLGLSPLSSPIVAGLESHQGWLAIDAGLCALGCSELQSTLPSMTRYTFTP